MAAKVTRRGFLEASLLGSGALLIGMHLPGCTGLQRRREMAEHAEQTGVLVPNAWLQITAESEIIFFLDRVEMGQGTMTSHTMMVAEELNVEPATIRVEMAPAGRAYDNPALGFHITGGSTSVVGSWVPLRTAAAAAREMLRTAAAKLWKVALAECAAEDGVIVHRPSGRRTPYGELTRIAALVPVPDDPPLKPADRFRFIGKSVDRLDARMKVDGTGVFGMDVRVPGMLQAVVIRCPVRGGTARRFLAEKALGEKGVQQVFEVPSGVAVVADSYWQARTAAALVEVDWDEGPLVALDDDGLRAALEARARAPGKTVRDDGDADRALARAGRTIEAVYEVPYLAHATMEPMSCTAHVTRDRCEIWAPTQGPGLAREVAARITGLPRRDVVVHTTLLGGGFGRRLAQDYVAEAVHVSRHLGKPVQVIWSREDDMQNDFYRPRTFNVLRAALGDDGQPVAWFHRVAGQSILAHAGRDWLPAMAPDWMPTVLKGFVGNAGARLFENNTISDPTSVEGALEVPYALRNVRVEYAEHEPGVPVGFWRSVGHSENAFVVESFIDELAHAAGTDPVRFRRGLLAGKTRHLRVLDLATEKAGWGAPAPDGRHRGVAVHESFGSVCAQVVEVSVADGKVRVHRVVCAIDCGLVINPDIVTAQMESAIVFGLSAALKQQVRFRKGRVQERNFHQYRLLRMHEMPVVEVHIVPGQETPTGAGEPGLPPIAPAVANAIFAATGKRIRRLPIEAALREQDGEGA